MNPWHWLIVHLSQQTGTSNSSSRAYDFWSGFGSDIQEFAILGLVFGAFRKHNCHVPRCLRLGHHRLADGTPVCRKHHPDLPDKPRSLEELQQAHFDAKG